MVGQSALQSLALGQLGSNYINDSTVTVGSWGLIQCITDCTFTTLTSGNLGSAVCMSGTLASITLKAGMELRGFFIAITLATGSVIAYKA